MNEAERMRARARELEEVDVEAAAAMHREANRMEWQQAVYTPPTPCKWCEALWPVLRTADRHMEHYAIQATINQTRGRR